MTDELFNDGDGMENTVLRPVAYSDYIQARREKKPLQIELPGMRLTIDTNCDMIDGYQALRNVAADLLQFDYRYFVEN